MKLIELLNKYTEKYTNELKLIENEYDINNEKLNNNGRKVENLELKKLRHEKKASIFALLLGLPVIIGSFVFYIANIPALFIMIPASVIGITGYGIYKKNIKNIDGEIDKLKNIAYNERKQVMVKGFENNRRRNEVIEILKNLKSIRYFFEACNRQDYLNKDNVFLEKEFSFYLENNVSLLGALYLINSGLLSYKDVNSISKGNLDKLRTKTYDIDKKIYNNPGIFFNDDNVKMMSYERVRESRLNENSNDNPTLIFGEKGFIGYLDKNYKPPTCTNRRSDKYNNENTGSRKR